MNYPSLNRNGYEKLKVYHEAHALVLWAYQVTKQFPKEELFGLTSQMRRAVVSVVANIVEGYGRSTLKDKHHFFVMSRGSLTEFEYYLTLCKDLRYISQEEFGQGTGLQKQTAKLLMGLIRSIS